LLLKFHFPISIQKFKEQSLDEFVQLLCTQLGLKNHGKNNGGDAATSTLAERFSLMFDDRRRFVTERNKHTLQQVCNNNKKNLSVSVYEVKRVQSW
jgi:hypothetical protein